MVGIFSDEMNCLRGMPQWVNLVLGRKQDARKMTSFHFIAKKL